MSIKYRKIDHSWVSNEKDKNILCIDIHVNLTKEMLSTRNDTAHSTLGEKSNKMSVSLMASAMAQDESDEAKGYTGEGIWKENFR